MIEGIELQARNERIKFAAKFVNWLAILLFVAGIAGPLLVSDFSLDTVLLLLGLGVAHHVLALVIVGRLEKKVQRTP